ncbi:MAG: hypothetical protein ACREQH_07465 [Candidatus Binatus sp.]
MPKPSANAKSLSPFWARFAKASAFVAVFLSAVPTYQQWLKSVELKVPFQKVSEAEDQDKLWQDNKDCYKQSTPIQAKTSTNDALSVTVCPATGDILLDVQRAGGHQQITRWIGLQNLETTSVASGIFPASAFAEEAPIQIAQVPTVVLCQRFLGPGLILRRVKYANGKCVDQKINTYSGVVVSTAPASCNLKC